MFWITLLVVIVCILIMKCTYSFYVGTVGAFVMVINAMIGFCILLSNPLTVVDEGKKSTYNITGFSESTLHENKSYADDITYYT